MITISHFHFALIIVLVGVGSVALLIAIMEVLGREHESASKLDPVVPQLKQCPICDLVTDFDGKAFALLIGTCPRCAARYRESKQ